MTSKRTGQALAAAGALMLGTALILAFATFDGATVAEWNGLCHGVIGQLGQALSSGARVDCSLASTADTAKGWLFGLGAASLVASIVLFNSAAQRPMSRSAQPRFQADGTPGGAAPPPAAAFPMPPGAPLPQMPFPAPPQPTAPVPAPPQPTAPVPAPPSLQTPPPAEPRPQAPGSQPAGSGQARWEPLIWPLTAVAIAAILATGGVLAARALSPEPTAKVFACTAPAVRCAYGGMKSEPVEITVSADGSASVNDLRWSGWGSPIATANGVLELDNCDPDCAQGTYTPYSATVTLSNLQPYASGRAYATMRISAPGASDQQTFGNLVPGRTGA